MPTEKPQAINDKLHNKMGTIKRTGFANLTVTRSAVRGGDRNGFGNHLAHGNRDFFFHLIRNANGIGHRALFGNTFVGGDLSSLFHLLGNHDRARNFLGHHFRLQAGGGDILGANFGNANGACHIANHLFGNHRGDLTSHGASFGLANRDLIIIRNASHFAFISGARNLLGHQIGHPHVVANRGGVATRVATAHIARAGAATTRVAPAAAATSATKTEQT